MASLLAIGSTVAGPQDKSTEPPRTEPSRLVRARVGPAAERLVVTSTAFAAGAPIPIKYSDYGERMSPPLAWSGQPSKTETFAVVVEDPDAKAPAPTPYVHWVIFNIPKHVTSLPEAVPTSTQLRDFESARQGRTSRNTVGYFGPRPPAGDAPHHYHFQVFALDRELFLTAGASVADLSAAMKDHVLADGELIGLFHADR
jgi:Raf kinase inhibitor-like YbhB/YbcL family protein